MNGLSEPEGHGTSWRPTFHLEWLLQRFWKRVVKGSVGPPRRPILSLNSSGHETMLLYRKPKSVSLKPPLICVVERTWPLWVRMKDWMGRALGSSWFGRFRITSFTEVGVIHTLADHSDGNSERGLHVPRSRRVSASTSVRVGDLPADRSPEGSQKWSSYLVLKQNPLPFSISLFLFSAPPPSLLHSLLSSSSLPFFPSF